MTARRGMRRCRSSVTACCHGNALTLLCWLFGVFWFAVAAAMFVIYSHHLVYRGHLEGQLMTSGDALGDEQVVLTSHQADEKQPKLKLRMSDSFPKILNVYENTL